MAKILCIEDDPTQVGLFTAIFKLGGHNAHIVSTLEDGLSELERSKDQPFDFVLTDWNIEDREGCSVTSEKIVRQSDMAGIRTVILSAALDNDGKIEALVAETSNVVRLRKPSSVEQIYKAAERNG